MRLPAHARCSSGASSAWHVTAGRDALEGGALARVYFEALVAYTNVGCRPGGNPRVGVQAANNTGWTTKELHRQRKLLEAQQDALMDKMERDREADDDDEDDDEEDDGAASLPCLPARATVDACQINLGWLRNKMYQVLACRCVTSAQHMRVLRG